MKLKSLLLGSAAAMIAVTGARAADAVVAEPEPVEYVRVCDLYGAGFFYIPGTETCLNINGYVRVEYEYLDNDTPPSDDQWRYRVRLNFDTRNETDYGTLRSQIRLQSDGNGGFNTLGFSQTAGPGGVAGSVSQGDGFVGIDRALISLAGFRLGYSDSFTTTFHGYGNPTEVDDGYYGYDQAIFFDYTYAANGFEFGIGLQDSFGDTNPAVGPHIDFDYYAGIAYGGSWGRVAASYIYEENVDEGAFKLSARVNVIEGLSINGFYVGDDNGTTRQVAGPGEYAWGVGATYSFSPAFRVDAGYTDADFNDAGVVVVGARWNPVPGLSIRPTASFFENDDQHYNIRVYRTW